MMIPLEPGRMLACPKKRQAHFAEELSDTLSSDDDDVYLDELQEEDDTEAD